MAAGDVEVYGGFDGSDTSAVDTGLTGNGVVVADKIVPYTIGSTVYFVVIKAA